MRAVVEEIENNFVCFVPDNKEEAIYIEKRKLPKSVKVKDVVELVYQAGEVVEVISLEEEKEKRLEANRLKREKLLKRKKKKE